MSNIPPGGPPGLGEIRVIRGRGSKFLTPQTHYGFFFTENRAKRWKFLVKVMFNCKFIHPRWVTFMKKWDIHTLFMSIILGFCQKSHTFSLPTSIGGFRGPGMMVVHFDKFLSDIWCQICMHLLTVISEEIVMLCGRLEQLQYVEHTSQLPCWPDLH
jgi:hypothetical protein